jgi:hypothetical protein
MYNPYNPYSNQFFNPQSQNRYQPMEMSMTQQNPVQTQINRSNGLSGKLVDSIDVVKAMDISLDGSINYFPLADNSAIVTKQLQTDGTSKIVVYKPVDNKTTEVKYVTQEDVDKAIKKIDLSDIKDDIKTLKKQVKDLRNADE